MVFDFFRKNKPEPEPAPTQQRKPLTKQGSPTVAAKTIAAPPVQETLLGHDQPSTKGLVVEERSHIGSAVEEAAIFFASGSDEQALATLKGYLAEHPTEANAQPWLMLLELYQQQRQKVLFEELALEFVMRFERSAPSWIEPDVVDERKVERTSSDYYALKGALTSANNLVDLDRMATVASAGSGLRLDVARVESIDSAFAEALAQKLKELRQSGTAIRFVSGDKLKKLVADAAAKSDRGRWALLFEIFQITGMQAEFEDQAIEFAIAFEESPPSWEDTPVAAAEESPAGADDEAQDDAFFFKGALSSGCEQQFKELAKYAANRQDVLIDLADVPRIDFMIVGQFIEALVQLTALGKSLTLRGANEMVQALLAVMGITQFATLQKKKAR